MPLDSQISSFLEEPEIQEYSQMAENMASSISNHFSTCSSFSEELKEPDPLKVATDKAFQTLFLDT